MITDEQLNAILGAFYSRFNRLEKQYLRRIAEHLMSLGTLTASDIGVMSQLRKLGTNIAYMRDEIAAYADVSADEMLEIMQDVAEHDVRVTAEWLTGTQPSDGVVHEVTKSMRSLIDAQAQITQGTLRNLSQTTVDSDAYVKAVDTAITAVQSSAVDYTSAIRKACISCATSGLKVVYDSGYKRRLDSAVRQNVLDGVRSLSQQVTTETGKRFGANGIQLSAHLLCAPDHLPYQGKQLSNSEFNQIQYSLQRPFFQWNCRHVGYPAIIGVTKPTYTEEQLKSYTQNSAEKITIGNRTLSRYEWTQEQRKIETKLRDARNVEYLAHQIGDTDLEDQASRDIRKLTGVYNAITSSAGLKPKMERTIPMTAAR